MTEPQEPEGIPFLGVPLAGPVPGALADVWSILEDLKYVTSACRRIMALPTEPPERSGDDLLQRALWESAVIAYGRCFTGGKGYLRPGAPRTKVPEDFLDALDEDERRIHTEVLEERNQQVGHRVGLQEQATVILILNPPPGERAVAGVAVFGVRLLARTGDDLALLERVTTKLGERLTGEYQALQQALMVEGAQRLDEWYTKAAPMD
ncbi:MAG: hypothetical protein M3P53_05380 [Actinomycetota bacterium]|nr:hypothetical protein [Actinomycetota bacterium]